MLPRWHSKHAASLTLIMEYNLLMANPYVLESKFRPPQISGNLLKRQRVINELSQASDYRLMILQAGAGYGKSTALTWLSEEYEKVIWYQVSEEDQDPLVFLLHLCHATAMAFPDLDVAFYPLGFVPDQPNHGETSIYRGIVWHIHTGNEIVFTCWEEVEAFIHQVIPLEILKTNKGVDDEIEG